MVEVFTSKKYTSQGRIPIRWPREVTGIYVTSWRLRNIVSVPQTYVGDPEQCRRVDDSPDDPGISNALGSSDARGASGGGPSRGA